MSRTNPIVERIRSHRAWLQDQIVEAQTRLDALKTEAASFDRVMVPAQEASKPERKPRQSRKIGVTAHTRQIGAVDPGPTLPIAAAAG